MTFPGQMRRTTFRPDSRPAVLLAALLGAGAELAVAAPAEDPVPARPAPAAAPRAAAAAPAPAAPSSAAPSSAAPSSIALPPTGEPDQPSVGPVIRTDASLLSVALARPATYAKRPVLPGTMEAMSLFAVQSPEERQFARHDLIQIIVREQSRAKSGQTLDTKKDYTLAAEVAWANFNFEAFGEPGVSTNSGTHDAPVFEAVGRKKLKGEGDYDRTDEFTTRMTAEVVEVLPNGNLVLEARTTITSDKESTCIKLTGICRPEDITAGNTVLSNQVHDLKVEKMNTGFVKDAADKGVLAQVLDAVFAF